MADVWPVELAGILMDDATLDADGVRWARNSLDGWDSPPVRVNESDRTGTHGGYGPVRLYAARTLVLSGMAYCPDMATAERVRDRLHTMPGSGGKADLIVHAAVPKVLEVVMGGEPRSSWPLDMQRPYVRFQLPLIAHDPFKRALTAATETIAAGATGTFTAAGTAPAEIEVTTTSSGTVTLSMSGLTLRTSSLPSGSVLTSGPGFTNPKRTVVGPGGENLFGLTLAPMQWPAVVPGSNSFVNSGTAAVSVRYFPTYA